MRVSPDEPRGTRRRFIWMMPSQRPRRRLLTLRPFRQLRDVPPCWAQTARASVRLLVSLPGPRWARAVISGGPRARVPRPNARVDPPRRRLPPRLGRSESGDAHRRHRQGCRAAAPRGRRDARVRPHIPAALPSRRARASAPSSPASASAPSTSTAADAAELRGSSRLGLRPRAHPDADRPRDRPRASPRGRRPVHPPRRPHPRAAPRPKLPAASTAADPVKAACVAVRASRAGVHRRVTVQPHERDVLQRR